MSDTALAEKKIYEPEWEEENSLPDAVVWENLIGAPTSVADLNAADGAALDAATTAIDGLGDLAYEDLVDELHIADEAVSTAKIAIGAIQEDLIAAAAITNTKISDDAISTPKLQAGAITAAKIAAGTITANEIAASTITAAKMNVSTLSSITANVGTLTAGNINGLTITGGTIRTASSGTRVQLDSSTNELQIYSGSTKRARAYDQGMDWYNSSGTLKGSIYVNSNDMLIAADITSTGNLYFGAGSSGTISHHIGTGASTIRQYIDDGQMWLGDANNFDFEVQLFGDLFLNNGIYSPHAGAVSSGGSASGGTQAGSWSITHSSTGIYVVNHNLGNSSYTPLVVLRNSTATLLCTVSAKSSNSFTVRIGDTAGTLTNAAFDFAIMLYN